MANSAQTTQRVFISSTVEDLPAHRQKVIDACQRLHLQPDAMEHWPAQNGQALAVVLERVEQCHLFVGIYGRRYGFIPPGETKSITELEFDHATELNKPRLVFIMADDHGPTEGEPEPSAALAALQAFKQRVELALTRRPFRNPDHLATELLHSLFCQVYGLSSQEFQLYVDQDFPKGSERLFGREQDLANLEAAWAGGAAVIELVAAGGTGKTALLRDWMQRLAADQWRGLKRVFAWSFYSQGSIEDRQASDDHFLARALEWFGVEAGDTTDAAEKGRRLAQAVAAQPTLLVLDGVEPLQYPPGRHLGDLSGHLRAPGLQALLSHLAAVQAPGLVLLSSREQIKDLAGDERNAERPNGPVFRRNLADLADSEGARLLHALGANKAGAAAIPPDDEELRQASREVGGHALTLRLLGSYLAAAHAGDVRKRQEVDFQEADQEIQGGHAFKVMGAYEIWFRQQGSSGARELAALRLMGYFDRPAPAASLTALRAAPAIEGLTEPLQGLSDSQWRITLHRLQTIGLLLPSDSDNSLDAHPLVREYFANRLEKTQPKAWREGHRRIYEQLKADTPHRPDTLPGLQPLYQAVAHGCRAGLFQEACDEVYCDRILRGAGNGGFYSTKKLGAFGADLGAIAGFFRQPWSQPAPELSEADQAWLLNEAAFSLRALGRLAEALEPMRTTGEINAKAKQWQNAAVCYSNLSELQLSLGRIADAVADGERAVDYADRSGDGFHRMAWRTTLADAQHQQGQREAARQGFLAAEAKHTEFQPQYPLLYSLLGFEYCDMLLAPAERAVWRTMGEHPLSEANEFAPTQGEAVAPPSTTPPAVARRSAASPGMGAECAEKVAESRTRPAASSGLQVCAEVAQRTGTIFEWRKLPRWNPACDSQLDIALDHLTLARCALYADLLQDRPPGAEAQSHCTAATAGLRKAGQQDYLPRALLTLALLQHRLGQPDAAAATLAEAQRIAARGGMKLRLADIALTRARLFHDREQLTLARQLIEECGYGRRLEELQDAEAAVPGWP